MFPQISSAFPRSSMQIRAPFNAPNGRSRDTLYLHAGFPERFPDTDLVCAPGTAAL